VLRLDGRRYRGEVEVTVTAAGLLVVNRLGLEDYLRGVVPREVGSLSRRDHAAIEAQAVASRSYAVARLASPRTRSYDMSAGVADQVYGGADAERPESDAAVAATAGEVLRYDGRVADAPYHSTCGGSTAAPDEVWQERFAAPYLRPVSDRDPATGRAYCELSPRFAWRRTLDGPAAGAAIARYLDALPAERGRTVGRVRGVRVVRRTPSGRVAELALDTDAGPRAVRGNQIRSALRAGGGEILHSTYFSVESMAVGADGRIARLTLDGAGNGHGVGMCQWGAVGRARAGHDYRAILRAYYPGTTLGDAGAGDGRYSR
jgi:stage II sporulation protein D